MTFIFISQFGVKHFNNNMIFKAFCECKQKIGLKKLLNTSN